MNSITGSPILNFTASNHGISNGMLVELTGPTAEFSGLFSPTNCTDNTFVITLPKNATATYTSQSVSIARPALQNLQLSHLSRLIVTGTGNFLNPPQYNGAEIKPRYDYFVQTRAQAVLTSGWGGAQNPANLYGTKIPQLDITFTPKKAGNTVVLDWAIHGEAWNGEADMAFVVTRTPNSGTGAGVAVALPDSVDASNNTWSGVTGGTYDTNEGTTPSTRRIKIVDFNTLAVPCTYSVHFRAANNRTATFHLNRSATTVGSVDNETGLSLGHAHEIYV
jgi:hypothetical protein